MDELVHGPRRISGGVIAGEGDCRDDYACWFDEEVLCRLGPGIRWQTEETDGKGDEERHDDEGHDDEGHDEEGHDDEAQASENKEEAEMTTGRANGSSIDERSELQCKYVYSIALSETTNHRPSV